MIDTVLAVDIGTTSLKSGLITERGEVVSFYTYRFQNPCNRFIANEWAFAFGSSVRHLIERAKCVRDREGGEAEPRSARTGWLKNGMSRVFGARGVWSEAEPGLARPRPAVGTPRLINIKAVSISGNGPTVVLSTGMTVRWNEKTPEYDIPDNEGRKSLFLPKILALKNLFPGAFEKSKYVFSGPEYLIYQLTGNAVTVLPEARFETAYWNDDVLASVGIKAGKMPPYIGVGELCGCISADVIAGMGLGKYLDKDTPVFSAGPDFTAAMIGTNTLAPGKICDRSGSSEGFNFCIPRPVFSEGARSLPSVIPGLWNISILTPASSRLAFDLRLKRVTDSVNKLRQIAKENNLDFPDYMVVTGGQAKSPEYMKRKARLTKMNLVVSNCSDSELMGDACCGWLGLGVYSSLKEAADSIVKECIVYEGL